MRVGLLGIVATLVASVGQPRPAAAQESLPHELAGSWRITRVLPVHPSGACWTQKDALPLVGTELRYSPAALRWKGGSVPLTGITTRTVTAADLAQEEPRGDSSLTLADLGFPTHRVREVNLQHEDADITGATTEVPGDSVLLAGPGRLVLSACGVYLEARRLPTRATPNHFQPPAAPPEDISRTR